MHLREDLLKAEQPVSDDELLALYRGLYRGYFNEPGFRALLEAFPSYMTWDDHEIFDGWGSLLETSPFDRTVVPRCGALVRGVPAPALRGDDA